MKICNFLGYSSYKGYTDLKTNFKNLFVKEIIYEFDLILAMKFFNFLGYGSYTGYTDLKTNLKTHSLKK